MKRNTQFSIRSRLESFAHAFQGLGDMIRSEHNAWIHALATVSALGVAWHFGVSGVGFALILTAIVIVWVAEAFNTVLEIMADLVVGERYSKSVKRAKDIAAAGVLIASVGAIGIGVAVLFF